VARAHGGSPRWTRGVAVGLVSECRRGCGSGPSPRADIELLVCALAGLRVVIAWLRSPRAQKALSSPTIEEAAKPFHLDVVGPAQTSGAIAPLDDQLRAPKHTEMLRHCRPGDVVESGGDVGCGHLHGPDQAEDLPAPGLGQGSESGVDGSVDALRAPEADRTRNSLQAG
jgi:hypothetical protein